MRLGDGEALLESMPGATSKTADCNWFLSNHIRPGCTDNSCRQDGAYRTASDFGGDGTLCAGVSCDIIIADQGKANFDSQVLITQACTSATGETHWEIRGADPRIPTGF